MTLHDTIRLIESIASSQPSIKMIVENDIWKLNAEPSADYGVFGFRQTEHSANIDNPTIDYGFEFYYIDRLTADRSNQIEVQSVGVQTLDNIVRKLAEDVAVSDYRFVPFYQRFADECSGVICTLSVSVPVNTICAVDNDPFLVKII